MRLFIALVFITIVSCTILGCISGQKPLIRGVAENMLVSPNRPDVAVSPAASFTLVDAYRADPAVMPMNSNVGVTVKLWCARYVSSRPEARLIAMFGEVGDPWTWHPTPKSPGNLLHRKDNVITAGLEGTSMTYILPVERDPWRIGPEPAPWNGNSLVCRFVFNAFFHYFTVLVEYREPLEDGIETNPVAIASFEKRAANAFALLRGTKEHPLPRVAQNLPYPPKELNRSELGKIFGPIWGEKQ